MLTVVADTNLFLQCKPLQDINWLELDPAGVRVVVPMTVVKELDKAKGDGNGRRARRARAAVALFRKGVATPDGRLDIDGRPNCTWEFGSGEAAWHDSLDRDLPDHRLLAEARYVAQSEPETLLLSGDISVLVLAGRLGLRAQELPEDWLRAAEPDERDKRIQELSAELAAVRAEKPAVAVSLKAPAGIGREGARFDFYRAATEYELDELLRQSQVLHPCATAPRATTESEEAMLLSGAAKRVTASSMVFRKYRDTAYPKWLVQLRKHLGWIPTTWSWEDRCIEFAVNLSNAGHAPAFGLVVELHVHGGGLLVHASKKETSRVLAGLTPPSAPVVPEPIVSRDDSYDVAFPMPTLPNFDFHEDRSRRHPHDFYRESDGEKPVEKEVWECEEFRHDRTKQLELRLLLPEQEEGTCTLVCTVSAKNMPQVREVHKVHFKGRAVDPVERLTESLQPKKSPVTLRLPRHGPTAPQQEAPSPNDEAPKD